MNENGPHERQGRHVITFEQARDILDKAHRAYRPSEFGTFMVADYGWEDARYWHLVSGTRGFARSRSEFPDIVGQPAILVDKETGEITYLPMADEATWVILDAMTPVGDVPSDDEEPA
jgi:hypothetical protein